MSGQGHRPEAKGLHERRKHASQLVDEVLAPDQGRGSTSTRPVATPLADSPETFRLAVPRLLEFLVRGDPSAREFAAELLARRTHWIEGGDLNDFMVCALRMALPKIEDPWVAHHLLAGVLLASPALTEPNVRAVAKIANQHLLEQQIWPLRGTFSIGLLGERLPRRHLKHSAQSIRLVIEQYRQAIETQENLYHAEPDRILQVAAASLFAQRGLLDSRDRNGMRRAPEQELRAECRKFIFALEAALEQETDLRSAAMYHLLFAAVIIDPAWCPAIHQSLEYISELAPKRLPAIRYIIDRLRHDGGFVQDTHTLCEHFDPNNLEDGIFLVAALMHTIAVVERGAYGIAEGTAWILYNDLSVLLARIQEPFQAFFVAELQRALEQQLPGL